MDCKVYVNFYMALNGIVFHGHLDYVQKPSLGGRPNTKALGEHGTLNAHNHWLLYFIVW